VRNYRIRDGISQKLTMSMIGKKRSTMKAGKGQFVSVSGNIKSPAAFILIWMQKHNQRFHSTPKQVWGCHTLKMYRRILAAIHRRDSGVLLYSRHHFPIWREYITKFP
jgi:hypothetical protein